MDILSYLLGLLKGRKESNNVTIDSDTYIFTDAAMDGNVVVEEVVV